MAFWKRAIEHNLTAHFPESCVVQTWSHLTLVVGSDAPPNGSGAVGGSLVLDHGLLSREVRLDIHVSGRAFFTTSPKQPLIIPPGQKSRTSVFFLVRPEQHGPAELDIDLLEQGRQVSRLTLTTNVLPRGTSSGQNLQDSLNPSALTSDVRATATLLCRRDPDGYLSYTCIDRNYHVMQGGTTDKRVDRGDIAPFFEQIRQYTEQALTGKLDHQSFPSVLDRFRGLGLRLHEILVPREVREFVEGLKIDAILNVGSTEDWIPWELIFDRQDFWGMKFDLRRLPMLTPKQTTDIRSMRPKPWTSAERKGRVVNVVGHQLGRVSARAKATFDAVARDHPLDVVVMERPTTTAVGGLGEIDVLHLTCHGRLSQTGCYLEFGPAINQQLHADTVPLWDLKCHLVFANACGSATAVESLGELVSFGINFYGIGVRAFVGTLLPVPPDEAIEFACRFYERWLSHEQRVGPTLLATKREMASVANPFWLFYCLYGDDEA